MTPAFWPRALFSELIAPLSALLSKAGWVTAVFPTPVLAYRSGKYAAVKAHRFRAAQAHSDWAASSTSSRAPVQPLYPVTLTTDAR